MSAADLAEPPMLAARCAQETQALLRARLRVCCWLGVVLIPLFAVLDWIVYPQQLVGLAIIRVIISASNAFALLALGTQIGEGV